VFNISDINVVIKQELMPDLTRINADAHLRFQHWEFTGFQRDPVSTQLLGYVQAIRLADKKRVFCRVQVDAEDIQRQTPEQLFSMVDYLIKDAVDFIVTYPVDYVDGALCEQVACEACYS
jgi:hypothetical protein